MELQSFDIDDLKRRLRKLKRIERKIRFLDKVESKSFIVWDTLFDLREIPCGKSKYTLSELAAMSREEYKCVVDEFFALVYFEFYKENGIAFVKTYDPAILAQIGLPFNSDENDVKKKFRELAKKYHPDTGGNATEFIELMKVYEKLVGK